MPDYDKKLNLIWRNMKYRCYSKNLNKETARHYRDKGIQVCDEWRNDFSAFKEWSLSHGYGPELSIDRIDPDGNYEPSNCRWVTKSENSRRAMSKEEKRFYVARGDVLEYSQKFEAEEILSDAMTYADADEVIKQNYGNDKKHYRVVRSRIIIPQEKPKQEVPTTADRLIEWISDQDVNVLIAGLDRASKFVVAATLQAFVFQQAWDQKEEAE